MEVSNEYVQRSGLESHYRVQIIDCQNWENFERFKTSKTSKQKNRPLKTWNIRKKIRRGRKERVNSLTVSNRCVVPVPKPLHWTPGTWRVAEGAVSVGAHHFSAQVFNPPNPHTFCTSCSMFMTLYFVLAKKSTKIISGKKKHLRSKKRNAEMQKVGCIVHLTVRGWWLCVPVLAMKIRYNMLKMKYKIYTIHRIWRTKCVKVKATWILYLASFPI